MAKMNRANTLLGRTALAGVALLLSSEAARAHGEDKLGPNGGYIRMPGAFHTELKAKGRGGVEIFLLDVSWKDPITDGSVKATRHRGGATAELACAQGAKSFTCRLSGRGEEFRSGDELEVVATRLKEPGGPVRYRFPLTLGVQGGHDGH